MRFWTGSAFALFGLAALARAQRFGFTHRMLPEDEDGTLAVALGDVDGDGDLDAFAGNYYLQNRLYLNGGTGVFTDVTATNLPTPSDSANAIALADVDGDGDLDAYLATSGQDRLYLNGGTGVFTDVTATNLPTSADYTNAVALGDVDGDGDLDAFVGDGGTISQQNRLYLNGGTGVFTDVTATYLPALLESTFAVALGDVDGDGDLDVYVGNAGQDRLYLNGGTGVFTDVTATNLPALLDISFAVVLGDVDGDGDLDAFVGNSFQQSRLHLNDGTGIFTDVTATNLPALLGNTWDVAFGDVDGDGDLDAYVGIAGQQNRLCLNGGTGIFTDVTATNLPALSDSTYAVVLGDVDGDGDLDVYVGNYAQQDRLSLNDGTGIFTDVTAINFPAQFYSTIAVALGDVNGDGDLDAYVVNGVQSRLYFNGGTGVFTDVSATNLPVLPGYTNAVALGDVDGDGDLDVFVGNGGSPWQQDRLYLNGGTGVFTDVSATNVPALLDFTRAVELGDVDGDGDLDVYVGNYGWEDRLYLNDGTGVFSDVTATNLPTLVDSTMAVALGDVDGDGDLDAFVGNYGQQSRLLVNGGTGVFTDVTTTNLPALLDFTDAVALGDVDGDGDLDVFVGNAGTGGSQDRLYLNGGTGVFTNVTATNLPPLLDVTMAVALEDVDEDGDLDAFVGNGGSSLQQNRLFLNGGTGVFADVSATNLPTPFVSNTAAVAFGDVDGDGDLDGFVGNYSAQIRLYTNFTRQLAWRGIPRVGKPLVLDLAGPPGGGWLLAASLASASLPFPPFGTVRLAPASLFLVAGGALDSQGRANFSFLVPSNPALVGVPVYWQAVVGPPLLLTNLEITTATSL